MMQGQGLTAAVVLGGAASVWEELEKATKLCDTAGMHYEILACNDMIQLWQGEGIGCTLHPAKLLDWMNARAYNRFPNLKEVWCYQQHRCVTNVTPDWLGSVGLYGVKIALERGTQRVILCGVHMSPMSGHIVRGADKPWKAAPGFRKYWLPRIPALTPVVRSYGGWTRATFGEPTEDWLVDSMRTATIQSSPQQEATI